MDGFRLAAVVSHVPATGPEREAQTHRTALLHCAHDPSVILCISAWRDHHVHCASGSEDKRNKTEQILLVMRKLVSESLFTYGPSPGDVRRQKGFEHTTTALVFQLCMAVRFMKFSLECANAGVLLYIHQHRKRKNSVFLLWWTSNRSGGFGSKRLEVRPS